MLLYHQQTVVCWEGATARGKTQHDLSLFALSLFLFYSILSIYCIFIILYVALGVYSLYFIMCYWADTDEFCIYVEVYIILWNMVCWGQTSLNG